MSYNADESVSHLFFKCSAAIYMWSTSIVFGSVTRPTCLAQYFWWVAKILPMVKNVHILCVAAFFCWLSGNLEIKLASKGSSYHLSWS
jgi:hypothetical protein